MNGRAVENRPSLGGGAAERSCCARLSSAAESAESSGVSGSSPERRRGVGAGELSCRGAAPYGDAGVNGLSVSDGVVDGAGAHDGGDFKGSGG